MAFRQVYPEPGRRGAALEADARALREQLSSGGAERRDRGARRSACCSQDECGARPERDRAQFGEEFADEVLKVEPGRWAGPIRSGYGLHLVFVREREGRGCPRLPRSARRSSASSRPTGASGSSKRCTRDARALQGGGREAPDDPQGPGRCRNARAADARRNRGEPYDALHTVLASRCWAPAGRSAHEMRPGFLELRETGPGLYACSGRSRPAARSRSTSRRSSRRSAGWRAPGQQQLTPGRPRWSAAR